MNVLARLIVALVAAAAAMLPSPTAAQPPASSHLSAHPHGHHHGLRRPPPGLPIICDVDNHACPCTGPLHHGHVTCYALPAGMAVPPLPATHDE